MQLYGPLELNWSKYGNSSWVMTEQHVLPVLFFLSIIQSHSVLARSRIQTVLADRNVATVARREEGEAVC